MPKIGLFGHNTPFWGILGLFGPSGPGRGRGFTSTPGGPPGRGFEAPGGLPGVPGTPGGGPGPGPRIPGSGRPVPGGLPRAGGGPSRPWDPGPRAPGPGAEGGFTSTPRAGAPRFPAGGPGDRGPGRALRTSPGGLFPPRPGGGPRNPSPGTAGPRAATTGVIPLCGVPLAEPVRERHRPDRRHCRSRFTLVGKQNRLGGQNLKDGKRMNPPN